MVPFNLYQIASVLNAKHIGRDVVINEISINSNNIIQKQCMFVAIIGSRFDGHDFVEQAVIAGAKAVLVSRYVLIDVPQLIVINTNDALLKIAHWVRCQVSSKVIAITGSSGKTSVKEMTVSILKGLGNVVATQENFNNLIGVPITLLRLTSQSNFAVVELGTSNTGELSRLSRIVVANVAIVNNIFPSHLSGFGSLLAIKKEKGEIFSGLSDSGQAVINADNNAFSIWSSMLKGKSVWRFSLLNTVGSNFFASNIICNKNGVKFILNSPCGKVPVFLAMLGWHNVVNALAASALAFSVGANLCEIVTGLENMQALSGRLSSIIFNKGKLLLLDDTYNSNVGSMVAAIYVLNKIPGYRVLVVSDMLELGTFESVQYHCDIGKLIAKTNIDQVLTIGDFSYYICKICKTCKRVKHFQKKSRLIAYIKSFIFQNQDMNISFLIKGSRCFHMEDVFRAVKDYAKCFFG